MSSNRHRAALLACLAWLAVLRADAQADAGADLRSALELHEAADDFRSQEALVAFRVAVERHPDVWLAHFWAAYAETQIARLVGRGLGEGEGPVSGYLDRAQAGLDRAAKLTSAAPAGDRAALAALQALLYRFRAGQASEEARGEWSDLEATEMRRAVALDPDRPAVLVSVGTDLVGRSRETRDASMLLGGVVLLRRAETERLALDDRSQTTFFNAEWLPFWLPMAEEVLDGLDGADGAGSSP